MNPEAPIPFFQQSETGRREYQRQPGPRGAMSSLRLTLALRAEILSYSRSRGLFAGAFLRWLDACDRITTNKRPITEISPLEIVLANKISPPLAAGNLRSE